LTGLAAGDAALPAPADTLLLLLLLLVGCGYAKSTWNVFS
jgi:hypothetical protein